MDVNDFSCVDYWDGHYQTDKAPFDWYHPWSEIKPLLTSYVVFSGVALNVGCGTSSMSADLLTDGFTTVHSIDFSDIVVDHMRAQTRNDSRLKWAVADCTDLSFPDGSIDYVFDKGTFDCLTTSPSAAPKIEAYLNGVSRVLAVNGCFVIVSFGSLRTRTRYFRPVEHVLKLIAELTIPKLGIEGATHHVYVLRRQWDDNKE
jgi:ubiquinone/menaquinone biosynthesis C-methylase UbiE